MADNIKLIDLFDTIIITEASQGIDQFGNYSVIEEEQLYVPKQNIADMIEERELEMIGNRCAQGSDEDESTMAEWNEGVKKGKKLAKQENKALSIPWEDAANFKSPVITSACYRFSDAVSTEILRPYDLVSVKIIGDDPDDIKEKKADNYSKYANWQINEEMPEWRCEQEKLLYDLPMEGTSIKKVFFNTIDKKPESKLISFPNFILDNTAKSVARLRRFGEIMEFSRNEVEEKIRNGDWIENDIFGEEEENDATYEHRKEQVEEGDIKFIEQQGFYDLDGDGYEEPYTFVFHCESQKIVRMVPRFELDDVRLRGGITLYQEPQSNTEILKIKPNNSIVMTIFLKDIIGCGLLGVGYAHLLSSFARAINAATNNLLNTATLSNVPGGFLAKGFRAKMGNTQLGPGQWNQTEISPRDLAAGVLPNPTKEPSPALFQLMGALVANAEEMSASTNIISAVGANAPATTTLSLLMEQQQTRSAIVSRIYRSMTQEFKMLFELNKKYTDPATYAEVVGDPNASVEEDLDDDSISISPSANPDVSSKVMRVQQAQAAMSLIEPTLMAGGDAKPIIKNYLEAIGFEDAEEVLPELTPDQVLQKLLQDNPDLQEMIMGEKERADALIAQQIDGVDKEEQRKDIKLGADVQKLEADTVKSYAEAALKEQQAETEDLNNDALIANTGQGLDGMFIENKHKVAETERVLLDNEMKKKELRGEDIGDTN